MRLENNSKIDNWEDVYLVLKSTVLLFITDTNFSQTL